MRGVPFMNRTTLFSFTHLSMISCAFSFVISAPFSPSPFCSLKRIPNLPHTPPRRRIALSITIKIISTKYPLPFLKPPPPFPRLCPDTGYSLGWYAWGERGKGGGGGRGGEGVAGGWVRGCRLLISRPELRLVGSGEDFVLLGRGEVGEADAGLCLRGNHDGRSFVDD